MLARFRSHFGGGGAPFPPLAPTRPLAELTRRRGVDAAAARLRLVDWEAACATGVGPCSSW